MRHSQGKPELNCPSPDISAYLDGELSADVERTLELHIADCRVCAEDLNLQKSFLNALGLSLGQEKGIELPSDFTESVVARAESRVSGLRHPHERRHTAFVCAGLILFSLVALGSNAESTFAAGTAAAEKVFAVALSVWHVVYDIALGSTIVFRSLASAFLFDSTTAVVLVLGLFVLSLFIFSRLLGDFRRT